MEQLTLSLDNKVTKSSSKSTTVSPIVKHFNKGVSITDRPAKIQAYVSHLRTVHQYPVKWYRTISDIQITRMYEDSMKKISGAAISADDEKLRQRLLNEKRGEYQLVALNKCSMRFTYTTEERKQIHGIISTYETKGYALEIGRRLSTNELCVAWQNGSVQIIDRSLLISKILSTASINPKEVIHGINQLVRTK